VRDDTESKTESRTHRSKQAGLALSISDHMCQRVWGGVPIYRRKAREAPIAQKRIKIAQTIHLELF
jgi:hypothetical protein